MKKILNISFLMSSLIFMLITSNCFAWQDAWTKAVLSCKEENYQEAEKFFNAAIHEIETNNDQDHPFVYVDRARLYLLLDRNQEVLTDVDRALASNKLTSSDRIRAVVTRLMARSRLKMDQGVLEDLKYFAEVNKDRMPKTEVSDNYLIVRNIPECECYQRIMTNYYIQSGICNSEEDIEMTSSGICIVRRKANSNCQSPYDEGENNRKCNACEIKAEKITRSSILDCQSWCDRMAIGGAGWCAKYFKSAWCQVACTTAVYEIQQGCYWCCETGNFYRKCVKPFEDIVGQMGNVCDPAWD